MAPQLYTKHSRLLVLKAIWLGRDRQRIKAYLRIYHELNLSVGELARPRHVLNGGVAG